MPARGATPAGERGGMDEPLQVAIIGRGWAGTRHARAFAAGGARPRWAVDLDGGRAEVQRLRIDGDLGSLDVGEGRRIRLFSERPDLLPPGAPMGHEIAVPEADTFRLEVAHFLQAVREGREPITSGRSQRGALAAVLAAYRSMATGQAVRVALEGEPADGRG